jgi:hypothetical protein
MFEIGQNHVVVVVMCVCGVKGARQATIVLVCSILVSQNGLSQGFSRGFGFTRVHKPTCSKLLYIQCFNCKLVVHLQ